MAKYTIMMGCGHEDTIVLFGKDSERHRKIEYFKENGLCKECYKKKMDQLAKAEGFVFNASVLPAIDNESGEILLSVWFSGNTMPHKDEIKQLGGYWWSDRQAANDFYFINVPKCWNKTIKWSELDEELKKAVSIGANHTVSDDGLFAMVHYQIALKMQKDWEIKKEKILELSKPKAPSILIGHKWNHKVYGKSRNYSIYLDGEKINISDKKAKELKNYIAAKEEYKKKVEEIENEKKS